MTRKAEVKEIIVGCAAVVTFFTLVFGIDALFPKPQPIGYAYLLLIFSLYVTALIFDKETRRKFSYFAVWLIVVIVIIGLLAALVLFAISSVPAAILTAALIILYGMYRFRR